MGGFPVLTILIFLPVVAALVCLAVPGDEAARAVVRPLALAVTVVTLILGALMLANFPDGATGLRYEEQATWIPQLGVSYHLGVDGLSVLLVALTPLLATVAMLASWDAMAERPRLFAAFILLLEGAVIGALCALDLILYFVFWEAMLVPLYLLIGAFGGPRRGAAALKFFIYTSVGSLLMFLAILTLAFLHADRVPGASTSFALSDLIGTPMSPALQTWLFLAFALAFAIKLPLFPLHSWLPDAYTQAPVTILVLATMLVKVGAYSFLRFAVPLFPRAATDVMPILGILAVIGIIYGGWVAARQRDMIRLLAYSSVAHLGFIALGIFALDQQSVQGSVLQMVNHGLSSGALFLIAGMLATRAGSYDLAELGGLQRRWPILFGFFMLAAFSSLGLPGLNGFVGEFLILLGAFQTQRVMAIVATFGVLIAAIYLLRLFGRTMHGPERLPAGQGPLLGDLSLREILALAPLAIMIVWLGVYPAPFLRRTEGAVRQTLAAVQAARPAPAADQLVIRRGAAPAACDAAGATPDSAAAAARSEACASALHR